MSRWLILSVCLKQCQKDSILPPGKNLLVISSLINLVQYPH